LKIYNSSIKVKILRLIWLNVWFFLFRFTPPFLFNTWRIFLLNLFGAKVAWSAKIYPSVRIFKPWNLEMANNSCLGRNVNCYNYDKIYIGNKTIISQNTFLCTASHNYNSKKFELITNKITIKKNVWVAANCFVGPGVTMNNNSVLLAMSNLIKNTKENYVYAGNPAKLKKKKN
jgi:putative colanic acid biosynthesis acetyltransferase WcaF